MTALRTGLTLGAHRLRSRFTPALAGISAFFVILAAVVERRSAPGQAADHTLTGAVFGIAIPLCAYAILARIADEDRLDAAANVCARHGWNRRGVTLGLIAVAALATTAVAVFLALVGVLAARGMDDPLAMADSLTSARIAITGGLAYVAWLSFASLFGRRGRGRFVALGMDWLLGTGAGWLSLPMPRGHLANLLGMEPVLGLSQPAAFAAVFTLSAGYLGLALWRTAP